MSARGTAILAALALALVSLPARAQHEGGHAGHANHAVEPPDRAGEHSTGHAHDHSSARPVLGLPPITDAERAAAFPDLGDATHEMMEDPFTTFVLFDRLELQDHDGDALTSFDLDAWFGRGLERLWLRSEGERVAGDTERAEITLLYGRSFARWWDWVAGARRDLEPGPARTWAAFGVQGLAPYRFELEATAFVGEQGRTAARLEAEYELLITNRWILKPLVEVDWYGGSDPARGIGPGLSSAEAGLRLRYEIRRELAPYVGVTREKKFGRTADLARAAGRDTDDSRIVLGVRVWF